MRDLHYTGTHATGGASGHTNRGGKSGGDEERGWERDRYNDRDRNRDWQCDALVVAGMGIALEHATPSSDGFCILREITRGGPVHISGYERSNGEVRRVQVGDWLLRVNDISCQDMPRDQIKRWPF